MNRPPTPPAGTRTLAQTEDTQDLESVISMALAARPIDTTMLRRGVWTYVGEERHAGTSPGRVILTLTELIEQAKSTSEMEQHAVMRRVILWCVEAYFGQLGDQLLGPGITGSEEGVAAAIGQVVAADASAQAKATIAHT